MRVARRTSASQAAMAPAARHEVWRWLVSDPSIVMSDPSVFSSPSWGWLHGGWCMPDRHWVATHSARPGCLISWIGYLR